ncbi:MAG: hypothetical protein N0C84_00885 [Candidatus Thiodiazotropha taylori]|uniref:Uncharacterized protein n=1 Tax=Candidatus Thiodiazotropha taylori TaxID=2792791 RepID=A0A9E4K9C4_9GAMM|nr:hypothetical protein [Candidatus Thiodiazotropha taylori]MCW4255000.1 hypothetical protein [Candidatus Thiodiazotropha taylori]
MMKVKGHHALGKNESGAVVVTDSKVYSKAKQRKREKLRVKTLEERLKLLEEKLERIINE